MAQSLKRASGTIKSVMHAMLSREKSEREGWETVGAALLDARGQFDTPTQFGAWIKAEGIDKLPGLATPPSRSDCIWMAEFPLCAGLIPVTIANPRVVRAAWRKLLAKSAKDWANAGVSFETAVHHVMNETICTVAEAEGAVGLATSQTLNPPPAKHIPVTKEEGALYKALLKAKKQGLGTGQMLDAAAAAGFAVYPPANPWTPPPEADTPALRLSHAIVVASVEGMSALDIDATVPTTLYLNYEEAYERARRALARAKDQALDLDEAKAMVKEIYLGDF